MARTSRHKPAQSRKQNKATSFMATCITCGVFIGLGLGVMGGSVLIPTLIGLIAGTVAGYLIDKRNGISYTRVKS